MLSAAAGTGALDNGQKVQASANMVNIIGVHFRSLKEAGSQEELGSQSKGQ